jgi:hypothetical protein
VGINALSTPPEGERWHALHQLSIALNKARFRDVLVEDRRLYVVLPRKNLTVLTLFRCGENAKDGDAVECWFYWEDGEPIAPAKDLDQAVKAVKWRAAS